MRKLRRGLARRNKRWMSSMAGMAAAAVLAGGTFGMEGQPVYGAEITDAETEPAEDESTQEEVKAIYLDGVQGNNENDGTTAETGVKTFTKAKKLAKKSGVSTIYVTGTITVTSSAEWNAAGLTVKKGSGFSGPIVSVAKGAVLTLNSRFLSEKDMQLADDSCLVIKGEKEEDKTDRDENKKEETGKQNNAGNSNIDNNGADSSAEMEREEENKKEETVKKKAEDIQIPDTFTMEIRQELGSLSLEECKGNGAFYWADSSYVPENQERCTIIFKPEDTDTYDYSHLEGWNEEKQTIRRKVTIIIQQTDLPKEEEKTETGQQPAEGEKAELKEPEESAVIKKEPSENQKETEPKEENSQIKEEQIQEQETFDETEKEIPQSSPEDERESLLNAEAAAAAASITEAVSRAQAGDIYQLIGATREFESLMQEVQDRIPQDVKNRLAGAQESAKGTLLSCSGLTVTGDFIPWYVQFKAELRPNAQLTEDMNVQELLASYDLKLWDLMNHTEYKIPEGEYVTVRMKVENLSTIADPVIIHTLEDGSREFIKPVVEGEWLVFQTSSFSPFDVGGSHLIVGVQVPDKDSLNSADTGKKDNPQGSLAPSVAKNSGSKSDSKSDTKSSSHTGSKMSAPKTGDETNVLLYAAGAGAAAAVVIFTTAVKKKKKENKE